MISGFLSFDMIFSDIFWYTYIWFSIFYIFSSISMIILLLTLVRYLLIFSMIIFLKIIPLHVEFFPYVLLYIFLLLFHVFLLNVIASPLESIADRKDQGWGSGKFFSGSGSLLFFKRLRLRLLIFFPSGSGSGSLYFFERLRLQGAKNTRLRLLGKICFPPQTSKVKLQKNIKQVK